MNGPIKFSSVLERLQMCSIWPLIFIKAHSWESKKKVQNQTTVLWLKVFLFYFSFKPNKNIWYGLGWEICTQESQSIVETQLFLLVRAQWSSTSISISG